MIIKNAPILSIITITTLLVLSAIPLSTSVLANTPDNASGPADTAMLKKLNAAQNLLNEHMSLTAKENQHINAVFVDPRISTLVIGIDTDSPRPLHTYENWVKSIVKDVPVMVDFGTFEESSCDNGKESECNPLWGGIEVQIATNLGTLGLGVTDDQNRKGFIVSGHVANPNTSNTAVFQPDNGNFVGTEIVNPAGPRFSDAAFVELFIPSSGTPIIDVQEDRIYKTDTSSYIVTSKKGNDQTPGGTPVKVLGKNSGEKSGEVVTINAQMTSPTYGTLHGQSLATFTIVSGDSGGPVFSPGSTFVAFYGISVGNYQIGSTTYGVFSPWNYIQDELNLQ